MAVDWSQFQPVAAQDTDWSQFQPLPDETQSGPPEASFRGVRADSATTATPPPPSPLSQFWGAVKDIPGNIATGTEALVQGGDYSNAPGDTRQVLGVGEGMLRDAADVAAGWANQAYQWSPMGVAERTAQQISSNLGGPSLPTISNVFEGGTEAAHEKVGINEDTMRFQSPRQEAVARFVPELLSNLIPVGAAAREADSLLVSGERAVQAEAKAGVHGPEAQGQAVADQLTQGTTNVQPPEPQRGAGVPASEVGVPAEPVPREAAPVQAPEPVQAETPAELPAQAQEQNPVTQAFESKLADHPTAAGEYAAIPDTEGGRVLNTDTARELSPDYLADRTKSADVHEPASAFIKRLYADKLSQPTPEGMDSTVLFTAGGTGAGKSTGLKLLGDTRAEIVYDTNMNKFESAKTKIDQALDAGRDVHILYTYRDPVEALRNGALPRAMRQEGNFGSGRTVPMAEHVDTHVGSYATMRRIAQEFKDDPRVKITAIDNSLGRGNAKVSSLDAIPNPNRGDLHAELAKALDEALAKREISNRVYEGFKSATARRAEQTGGAGVRGQPEPQRTVPNANELGAAHAPDVRIYPGPAGVEREIAQGGEVRGRGDIQQAGEAEGHALPQRLRGQGEAAPRPVQEPLGPTGIKNAQVTAEREAMGYEAVKHDLSRTDPEGWKRAEAKIAAQPTYGRDLAEELVKTPRAISKEEVFALTQDRQRIRTERRAAYTEAERAMQAGDTEGAAQARLRANRLDAEMDKNDTAARVTGHETAEGLRARQRLAQEDYSMAALVQRAKVKKGEALSPTERAMMEAHAAEIEKREAAVAAREAAVREAEAKPKNPRVAKDARKRFDDLAEEMKKATRKTLCEVA